MISNHPDLFTPAQAAHAPAVPYQRKSKTSRDAADRVQRVAGNHERLTFEAIVAAGSYGITRKELAADLFDRQQQKVCGRVWSLMRANKVKENGDRREGSAVIVAVGL